MVASCRLPLGKPRRSLLATGGLRLWSGVQFNGPGETGDCALVAHKAVALNFDAKKKRVVVAVGCGRDDAEAVAAGFALHPQFLAGATPKGYEAAFKRFGI